MNEFYKSYTVAQATQKLESYCAYQERCHEEVLQKLKSLNMIPQAIDAIIAHLLEHNFLNEERYARAFARGKFRIKKWGRRRIVQELKLRGISRYNIEAALKEINDEEYIATFNELAGHLWEISRETQLLKKKKKILDALLRKGYESNLIFDKVQELSK
ncbi:regulatory protein RecX [Flavobacterium sp. RHBU_24]|uniref:regulatory protein RecX n=1 Tax=Flavobacterium sp. RHBU_24 TaxID=3391185 RepID=UPI003984AF91